MHSVGPDANSHNLQGPTPKWPANSLALFGFLVLASAVFARDPFGFDSIRLPSGYKFTHGTGTDSYVGKIQKDGGLTITTDTGAGAGEWVRLQDKAKYRWFREIQIGGNPAYLAMGNDPEKKVLMLTYQRTPVNFGAEIHSEADIAEFIAILSTYQLPDK